MKITVVGLGYVGMANAVLLSQHNKVTAVDIDPKKVDLINKKISPIEDKDIPNFLKTKKLDLVASLDADASYKESDFVIIATPTNYDPDTNYFDTSSVVQTINSIVKINKQSVIVIKSTIPIGFVEQIRKKHKNVKIFFSPEFLREGTALYDNLHPSRIVVGSNCTHAKQFANLLAQGAISKDVPIVYTSPNEAEAIKLFSNTYLAMRVSYFNELDTFAEMHNFNTEEIIKGVSLDPRIGDHYNNPSFGYGGYCLPKDTKQLLANYKDVPQKIIAAIVESNDVRKLHVANMILQKKPKIVGAHRLIMKTGSDNFRDSAIQTVIQHIVNAKVKVIVYEPELDEDDFYGLEVEKDLKAFLKRSDVIIANRMSDELLEVKSKIYTRDIFREN